MKGLSSDNNRTIEIPFVEKKNALHMQTQSSVSFGPLV